jgi:ADP-heptose:LPS heptosyltransferase
VKVGILKPDHLGDLVLASPAIAALRRRFADLTLFCHPKSIGLAGHLFPGLPASGVLIPYLDKERTRDRNAHARLQAALQGRVELLVCLRWDEQIERVVRKLDCDYRGIGGTIDTHVALEHRRAVFPYTDAYDLLTSYRYPHAPPPEKPVLPGAIGLCISAGFPLNSWPLCHWLDLAIRLHERGIRTVLLGGPAETTRLQILAGAVRDALGEAPRVLVGGKDYGSFLRALAEAVDLVIATDSGTGHLASLVRPVLSLFGGSPWRRFAPLGSFNIVLSRHYPCSPCAQFIRNAVNLCHTQECLTNLFPEHVHACLDAYLEGRDCRGGLQIDGLWMNQAPWTGVKSELQMAS